MNKHDESFSTLLNIGISSVSQFKRWGELLLEELNDSTDPHSSAKPLWTRLAMEAWWLGEIDGPPEDLVPDFFREYARYTFSDALKDCAEAAEYGVLVNGGNTHCRASLKVTSGDLLELLEDVVSRLGEKFQISYKEEDAEYYDVYLHKVGDKDMDGYTKVNTHTIKVRAKVENALYRAKKSGKDMEQARKYCDELLKEAQLWPRTEC